MTNGQLEGKVFSFYFSLLNKLYKNLKIYSREDSLKINVDELYVLTNILKTCIIYLQGK